MESSAAGATPTELRVEDLAAVLGTRFGPGLWRLVSQEDIDRFADATDDHQWYHVDVDRARDELPDGKTIAHGLLTIAIAPALLAQVLTVKFPSRALNYGYDRVRLPSPVQAGDRIRLVATPTEVTARPKGTLVRISLEIEVERDGSTAMVADQLLLALPAQ